MKCKTQRVRLLLASCVFLVLFGCREVVGPAPSPTARPPIPTATSTLSSPPEDGPRATVTPGHTATEPPSASPGAIPSSTTPELPTPTAVELPAASVDGVTVRETTISLASYVYEPFLRKAWDEERGVPYVWLDRAAYGEPDVQSAVLRPFGAILLENRYLRLTIVPELGGRLYECVFKPTGQSLFYRNRVLKPTAWGPLTRDRNWWLAAGGMEWAFPVHEHGYESGVPWSHSVQESDGETTVTVCNTTEERPRVRVEIGLAPDTAYFTIRPHIENPTSSPISIQYWANAMLTLGGSSMSPHTEFVYPAEEVIVHSAEPGSGFPEERARLAWPVWQGRHLSWYHNWDGWLGLFVPEPSEDFVGAYNHDTDLGVARIFPSQQVAGVKLFAWGQESPYASEYADDGSQYFEMWGGPNLSFWPEDDMSLSPGASITWAEQWYPFHGTGGLDYANRELVLSLDHQGDSLHLGVAATSYQPGTVLLVWGDQELHRRQTTISPETPLLDRVSVPSGLSPDGVVSLSFVSADGETLARYETTLGSP
jgi:hypothetical protein